MRVIRLLVVEDDPAFLYLVQKAFEQEAGERFRWEVLSAINGQEAVDLLFAEENAQIPLPDLILLDWNLPGVDGDEVLRRIKQDAQLCRIPVLVFSASEDVRDVGKAYGGHANGYINKPQGHDVLAQIAEAIGQFWVTIARLPKVVR